jgi:hypothetical protein
VIFKPSTTLLFPTLRLNVVRKLKFKQNSMGTRKTPKSVVMSAEKYHTTSYSNATKSSNRTTRSLNAKRRLWWFTTKRAAHSNTSEIQDLLITLVISKLCRTSCKSLKNGSKLIPGSPFNQYSAHLTRATSVNLTSKTLHVVLRRLE